MRGQATDSISSSTTEVLTPWWGHISLLWLLFVPLCVAIYTLLLPIGPNDFWYHARAGMEIAQTGQIPTINGFSSSPPHVWPQTPYHFQSWISEWLMYRTLESFGLSGIIIERTLCMALAWAILVAAAWRRSARVAAFYIRDDNRREALRTPLSRAACGGALLAMAMSCNNFDTRPQMFSVPLFAVFVWLIWEWPHARHRPLLIALATLTMALWVNTHGAFFTGIILLILLLFGESAYKVLCTRQRASEIETWWGRAMNARAWQATGTVTLLAIAAACANPRGVGIFSYVRTLATNGASQKYIQEWQAPEFSFAEWHSLVFYLGAVGFPIVLWLVARNRRPMVADDLQSSGLKSFEAATAQFGHGILGVRASELLIGLALLVMALRDKRAIIWFAMFSAPAWSAMFIQLGLGAKKAVIATPLAPRATWIVNAVLAVALLASSVFFLPRAKAGLDWPPAFRARFAPTPGGAFPEGFASDPPLLLDRATPVEAVAWLKTHPPRGRVWHDMVFGSYMMWALKGRVVPMCDPRVELYPDAFWEEFAKISRGGPDALAPLDEQGYSDALLDPLLQAGLVSSLRRSPHWKEVLRAGPAIAFRRVKEIDSKNARKKF